MPLTEKQPSTNSCSAGLQTPSPPAARHQLLACAVLGALAVLVFLVTLVRADRAQQRAGAAAANAERQRHHRQSLTPSDRNETVYRQTVYQLSQLSLDSPEEAYQLVLDQLLKRYTNNLYRPVFQAWQQLGVVEATAADLQPILDRFRQLLDRCISDHLAASPANRRLSELAALNEARRQALARLSLSPGEHPAASRQLAAQLTATEDELARTVQLKVKGVVAAVLSWAERLVVVPD